MLNQGAERLIKVTNAWTFEFVGFTQIKTRKQAYTRVRTNFWTDKNLHASGVFRFHRTRRTGEIFVRTLVNSTAKSNRICTVPCKRAAQVKNSSVQKFVPDPCKRYASFRSILIGSLPRRRWQQECHLESDFALFQSSSRLFELANVVKCRPILPWVDFLRVISDFRKRKKISSSLDNFLRQTWNQAFSRCSRPVTANVEVVVLLINSFALLTCSLPSPRPLNMHWAFIERASEICIVDLCIFRVILDEQLLLLDNFTRDNNYLRSVPLQLCFARK